jgi:hypothetical protein
VTSDPAPFWASVADLGVPFYLHPRNQALAAGAGGVQALAGALHDELADELGQRREHVEDQPAARGKGQCNTERADHNDSQHQAEVVGAEREACRCSARSR